MQIESETSVHAAWQLALAFARGAALALSALLCEGAGSIFDNDWTPPKPVGAAHSQTQPAAPAPAPAVPPPSTKPAATNPAVEAPRARRPVPAKLDQARSRGLMREAFANQLKDRSIVGRRKLAQSLLDEAAKSADNASDEFVLLAGAIDASREASTLRLSFQATDLMASLYEVDALSVKTDSALKVNLRSDGPSTAAENVRAAMDLISPLLAIQDFPTAGKLVALVRPVAANDSTLVAIVQKRTQLLDTVRSAHERLAPQVEKLKSTPDDPAANLAVGAFTCFVKGDWQEGLPMLAKCGNPTLKDLAKFELSTPTKPEDIGRLADGWWDLSGTNPEPARSEIRKHAASFYSIAVSTATALRKTVIDQRIATAGGIVAATPAKVSTLSSPKGHVMTLREVSTRFTFPNQTFRVMTDSIAGQAEHCNNVASYVWLTNAQNMESFEFGFHIRAKWYHICAVEVDGQCYKYSRGHWGNGQSGVFVEKKSEQRIPGIVKSPTEYASMKVVLAQNKLTFYYNGDVAGVCDLIHPTTKDTMVKVGFSSHETPMNIKDVYLIEK